jgi:hypothetical protein
MGLQTFSTDRTRLQVVLKVSSMRLRSNTCLDTSYFGVSSPFKDPAIFAEGLTLSQWADEVSLCCDNKMNTIGVAVPPQIEI